MSDVAEIKRGPGRPRKEAADIPLPPEAQPKADIPDKPQRRNSLRNNNPADAPPPKEADPSMWDIGHRAKPDATPEPEAVDETAAATEAETASKAPAAKTEDLTDDILEEAVSLGVKLSQARTMGAAALRTALDLIRSRTSAPAPATGDAPAAAPNTFTDIYSKAIPEYATSLDEGTVDEGIAKDIKGLAKHANTYMTALQGGLAALRSDVVPEIIESRIDRFELFVEGLGKDWEQTFGKGDFSELNPNGQEIQARARLFDAWTKLRDESRRKGEVISAKKAFKKALGQEFTSELERLAKKPPTADKGPNGRFIARPTQREGAGDGLSSKDRGEKFAAGFLAERGFAVRPGNGSERKL